MSSSPAEIADSDVYLLDPRLCELGLKHDPEGFGYIAFGQDSANRAPRFGKPMDKGSKLDRSV